MGEAAASQVSQGLRGARQCAPRVDAATAGQAVKVQDGRRRRLRAIARPHLGGMSEEHFCAADRVFLGACRDAGGEIEIVLCKEGRDDPDGEAMRAHARTMVVRGYLEPLTVAGSRSRMQGAKLWVTFRARPAALALLEAVERIEALEAELARLRRPKRRPAA